MCVNRNGVCARCGSWRTALSIRFATLQPDIAKMNSVISLLRQSMCGFVRGGMTARTVGARISPRRLCCDQSLTALAGDSFRLPGRHPEGPGGRVRQSKIHPTRMPNQPIGKFEATAPVARISKSRSVEVRQEQKRRTVLINIAGF
jgi:hypothetical protein